MTGLEQFHQGKGDDKADRSPFEASQSQVEHPGQRVAQASTTLKCLGIRIDCNPSPFYPRGYDHQNLCSHRSYWICRHLCFTSAVADSGRIAFPSQTPAKHRAAKKAKATPAPATHPTPSPSPGKFNLGDLFKPRTSAAASPAAASSSPARGAAAKPANSPAPGGGHGKVWVNTETHVYHKEGSRFYGTTKKGKYMTEAEAIKEGNKAGQH
jgi:hypothetical protein